MSEVKKNVYLHSNIYILKLMENKLNNFFKNIWIQVKEVTVLTGHIDTTASSEYIKKNIFFKGPNAYILAFAIVIASVGLNVNSIPVIIGAMLISPLMGPILAIGYSIGVYDTALLRKASLNLLIMVIICLFVSTLYFLLSPLKLDNPTELLARTNPTIFDVLIALFGGLAGILEISKKEKGTVFAGVAIATALMPPLCTAGFGLASWKLSYFFGALYLFFINCVFISLATFLTVKYLKYPVTHFADSEKQKRVNRTITIFTLLLIIPSIYSAVVVIKENNFNQTARQFIETNKTLSKSYIYDHSINHHVKPPTIELSIAGEALSDGETEMLYRSAESYGIKREQVTIKQNVASFKNEITEKAVVQSIFERNDMEIKQREQLIAQMENDIKALKTKELPYKQIAREIIAQYPGMVSFSIARGAEINPATFDSTEQIILIVKFKNEIDESELNKLREWLSIRLDFSNLIIVQK